MLIIMKGFVLRIKWIASIVLGIILVFSGLGLVFAQENKAEVVEFTGVFEEITDESGDDEIEIVIEPERDEDKDLNEEIRKANENLKEFLILFNEGDPEEPPMLSPGFAFYSPSTGDFIEVVGESICSLRGSGCRDFFCSVSGGTANCFGEMPPGAELSFLLNTAESRVGVLASFVDELGNGVQFDEFVFLEGSETAMSPEVRNLYDQLVGGDFDIVSSGAGVGADTGGFGGVIREVQSFLGGEGGATPQIQLIPIKN